MTIVRKDIRLNSPSSRRSLKQRREPYWRVISKGVALGYRKGASGGTWIAKRFNAATGRESESLGISDDFADADGNAVLSFQQAQAKVNTWLGRNQSSYTVAECMTDYLADKARELKCAPDGPKLARTVTTITALSCPHLVRSNCQS